MKRWLLALTLVTALPSAAAAQVSATIEASTPIYATSIPAANLAPLHIAPPGTVVTVTGQSGNWWRVNFVDPKWGPRTGWVSKTLLRVPDSERTKIPVIAEASRPIRSATSEPDVSVRLFADFSVTTFGTEQSFEAALGSSTGPIFGGGAEVLIHKSIAVVARAGRYSKTGERVFLYEGESIRLGIPLQVRVIPVMFGVEYRLTRRRVSPYVGGDAGVHRYDETSDFSESDENVSSTFAAYGVHGGVHIQFSRWVGAGGEMRWITVPGALGEGGLSAEFDEDNLGGLSAAFKLTFGR